MDGTGERAGRQAGELETVLVGSLVDEDSLQRCCSLVSGLRRGCGKASTRKMANVVWALRVITCLLVAK